MAYDEELADRIRAIVGAEGPISEMRMFGGLAFLVDGNMAIAASSGDGIMVRVDPAQHDELVGRPNAGPMVMRGKDMPGWLRVSGDGIADDAALRDWAAIGLSYARTLPPKH